MHVCVQPCTALEEDGHHTWTKHKQAQAANRLLIQVIGAEVWLGLGGGRTGGKRRAGRGGGSTLVSLRLEVRLRKLPPRPKSKEPKLRCRDSSKLLVSVPEVALLSAWANETSTPLLSEPLRNHGGSCDCALDTFCL